jgi:hypothetical protein
MATTETSSPAHVVTRAGVTISSPSIRRTTPAGFVSNSKVPRSFHREPAGHGASPSLAVSCREPHLDEDRT